MSTQVAAFSFGCGAIGRTLVSRVACWLAIGCSAAQLLAAESKSGPAWRSLPLITNGHVDESWSHVGWGGFTVDGNALRTECDARGMGLLVYKPERFGNCQIRVVFKAKEAKSNSGVFVRIASGILGRIGRHATAFERDASGNLTPASLEKAKVASEREEGAWFAVHHGYEVQIMDDNDKFHRTGAIYSLAPSSSVSQEPGEWRTMIITLAGNRILVDLDGHRVTNFDPNSPSVPQEREWFEPKREPKRPEVGYIGLQNHDPGDTVWFREVSVRALPKAEAK